MLYQKIIYTVCICAFVVWADFIKSCFVCDLSGTNIPRASEHFVPSFHLIMSHLLGTFLWKKNSMNVGKNTS